MYILSGFSCSSFHISKKETMILFSCHHWFILSKLMHALVIISRTNSLCGNSDKWETVMFTMRTRKYVYLVIFTFGWGFAISRSHFFVHSSFYQRIGSQSHLFELQWHGILKICSPSCHFTTMLSTLDTSREMFLYVYWFNADRGQQVKK